MFFGLDSSDLVLEIWLLIFSLTESKSSCLESIILEISLKLFFENANLVLSNSVSSSKLISFNSLIWLKVKALWLLFMCLNVTFEIYWSDSEISCKNQEHLYKNY